MSKRLKGVDYKFWGTHIIPTYPTCPMAVKLLHINVRAMQKKCENVFPTTNANGRKTYLFIQKYLLSVYNGPCVPGIPDAAGIR